MVMLFLCVQFSGFMVDLVFKAPLIKGVHATFTLNEWEF